MWVWTGVLELGVHVLSWRFEHWQDSLSDSVGKSWACLGRCVGVLHSSIALCGGQGHLTGVHVARTHFERAAHRAFTAP